MTDRTDIVVSRPAQPVEPTVFDHEVEPVSLATVLRRRWLAMILVSLIVGAASCSAVWFLILPKYKVRATAQVARVVRPILFTDLDTDISRRYREYIATEAQVIVSPAVINATLNAPEVRFLPSVVRFEKPASDIRSSLKVEQVKNTQLLEISMTGMHADDMTVIVNTLLKTYLRLSEDRKREWDEKILSSLRREETDLTAKVLVKSRELRDRAAQYGVQAVGESGTTVDGSAAELHQLLTEAIKNRAFAMAKLEALDSDDMSAGEIPDDPMGFEEYLQADPELLGLKEQIRQRELAVFDDNRLGRGPAHPNVAGRAVQITSLREAVSHREAALLELHKTSLRRRLEAERLEAEIATKVHQEQLDKLNQRQSEIARQLFLLEDMRHERERLEQSLAQIRQKIWTVTIEQNREARVTIDSLASAPDEPNVDKRLKYSAAAGLMSLVIGAGFALVRDRLDNRIREPGEITARLGMPLLGSLERFPRANGIGLASGERILEPMRGISTALLASPRAGSARSRLITSPTAGGGKSSLAMNLAKTLAATGRQVLLVDGDNIGQAVTRAFDMAKQPGFKELLEGSCPPEQAVHPCEVNDLRILPAGQRSERFGELLSGRRIQEAIRSLFATYDEVIVDSPPVLASSNAVVLATLVDEVVLVVRAAKNTEKEVEAARQCLATVGDKLVGVILNAVSPKKARYGYGYTYS